MAIVMADAAGIATAAAARPKVIIIAIPARKPVPTTAITALIQAYPIATRLATAEVAA